MIGMQGVGEAPLCSIPFTDWMYLNSAISLSHSILFGKIFNIGLVQALTLSQEDILAQSYNISQTLTLSQTMAVQGIYNIDISQTLTVVSSQPQEQAFYAAISHPIFITDDVIVNNVYALDICQSIPIVQRLGWLIELTMSNTINITMEELEGLFNEFTLTHDLTTNMDDLTCVSPFGQAPDKDISNAIVLAQSLNGQFIYACDVTSNIELLATVSRR